MAPLHRTAILLWTLLVVLLVKHVPEVLAQGDPEHVVSRFQHPPARLFFFDDAQVRPSLV